jgi:hypothetical protein
MIYCRKLAELFGECRYLNQGLHITYNIQDE